VSPDPLMLPENSLLEEVDLDYRKLGLRRNPLDAIPVFSDSQPIPGNGYLRYYLGRLSSLIRDAVASRPACVYLAGPPGSGKSAILKALSYLPRPRGTVLPIYIRFPLTGGRLAFYNELVRRLPEPLLRLLLIYVSNNHSRMRDTYIGRKLWAASTSGNLWKASEQIYISPQYAIESISTILSILLDITDQSRIVIILDEFEHAWARFTGAQKYKWEESMVELFDRLGRKIIVALPLLAGSFTLGSRPYMKMYYWKGLDIDLILNVTERNVVEINCSLSTLKKTMRKIILKEVMDSKGKRTCEILLNNHGTYSTIGDAITDLRGRLLMMAYEGRNWMVGKDHGVI